MNDVAENLKSVREKIAKVGREHRRNVDDIQLVAVSKMQPAEKIEAALVAGHRLFGENRVQEAQARWVDFKQQHSDIRLHLIGPLQTNKARDAVALFDMIETVDRPDLAQALVKEMKKQGRAVPCLIQVNTGAEEQKAGVPPEALTELLKVCQDEGLKIEGLMCIPPVNEPPALHFAFLRKLAQAHNLAHLSMGMSADYEKAIPLGATYVRVGTAIFGGR